MNRGSSGGQQPTHDRPPGFNEAPIHESGKSVGMSGLMIAFYSLQ